MNIRYQLPKQLLSVLTTLLLICLCYRLIFFCSILDSSFESIAYRIMLFSLALANDLMTCLILTFFYGLLLGFINLIIKPIRWRNFIAYTLAVILILLMTVILVIKIRLFNTLFIALNSIMLKAYLQQVSAIQSVLTFGQLQDIVMIIAGVLIFVCLHRVSSRIVLAALMLVLCPIYFVLALYGSVVYLQYYDYHHGSRFFAMYNNPVYKIATGFMQHPLVTSMQTISVKQQSTLKLLDPIFLTTSAQQQAIKQTSLTTNKQNIVIFILESVGSHYIFAPHHHQIPMPFLKRLSEKSLWFANHYTTGNISALGQFSLFTGLYPNPTPIHYEMQEHLNFPTLATYLGKQYDSFFVSTSNNLYFAMGINRTFAEYDNADKIDPTKSNLYFNMFLDERVGFQFFLKRLHHAQSPFLAVYWSGAGHFPYQSYGYRRFTGQSFLHRYLNNLSLLDDEISATFSLLSKEKLLANTMLIVVGDHGESFGTHEGYYAHGQSLYEDEIKVPLLIYSSQLPPQTIKNISSSIDLVPTVLDLLSVPYHASTLQGESIFSKTINRQYIFVYGDSDEIAAIDRHGRKMLLSFSNQTCDVYNLKLDLNERQPIACAEFPIQQEAILRYRYLQPYLLSRYQAQLSS